MKIVISREYWGAQGAGVMIKCSSTGNYLWVKRSVHVEESHTWSLTVGGKLDGDEKPYQAAKRELVEELEYHGPLSMSRAPVYVYKDGSFRYSTFLAVVPREFSIPPLVPWTPEELGNWETEDHDWRPLNDPPRGRIHFGTKHLLENFRG